MRLVFAGTPATAVPSLRALLDSRHEVVAVVTRPDAPSGRGRTLVASPVKDAALEVGLEVLTPARPSESEFLDRLAALGPDCCPVVAYGALLPSAALAVPRHGWVNLHFSVLPAWRGAAPVQHAILAGDEITGASTFLIEEGLDTGPVFGVVTTPIEPTDTTGSLLERLALAGADLLVATLDAIEDGRAEPRAQPSEGVSLAPKVLPSDVRVDWTAPALRVDRLVRAATPEPGAWTTLRDRRVGLGPVHVVPAGELGVDVPAPGALVNLGKRGVVVGTGGGVVRLGEVRPEGRGLMAADAWVRGLRLEPEDRFE